MGKNKITFLGDSIVFGAGADKENRFSSLLSKKLNAEEINLGISGSRFARNKHPFYVDKQTYFLNRVNEVPSDSNLVIVLGGTNDWGHGDAPFGEDNDKTVDTFKGALNLLIEALIKKVGKEKILFVLPLPRINETDPKGENLNKYRNVNYILEDYRKVMRKKLNKEGILYLDLSKVMTKPTSFNNEGLFIDGTHPNYKGHEYLAQKIYDFLKSINYKFLIIN